MKSSLTRELERAARGARIGAAAAQVYLRTRLPRWIDRARGRDPRLRDLSAVHQRSADQILATATRLRGLLLKVCQVIGTRSDVFPPEYVRTLSRAQDEVPPRGFDEIREVVEQDLGQPLGAVFAEFAREPIAAASLAQVHRARLAGGREVAVKVQYPDIEHIVSVDLTSMRRIASVYRRLDPQPLDFLPLLDELQRHLRMELDFRREVESADRVRKLFEGDASVVVPRMHYEWCTGRVITMELVGGVKVNDVAGLRAAGISPADVSQGLLRIYTRMILEHGFFHADPHPGNLFVQPGPRFALVDFGLAKELPAGFAAGLFDLLFSMLTFDEPAMVRAFDELGFATKSGDPQTYVEIARRMVDRSRRGAFLGEFSEEMADELFEAIRANPIVRVPPDFVLVARAFALLSGIAHTLGHRANVLEAIGRGPARTRA